MATLALLVVATIGAIPSARAAGDPNDVRGPLDLRRVTASKDAAAAPLSIRIVARDDWKRRLLRVGGPGRLVVLFDVDPATGPEFKGRVRFVAGALTVTITGDGVSLEPLPASRPDRRTVVFTVPGDSPANREGQVGIAARSRFRGRGCHPACVDRAPDSGWVLAGPASGGGGTFTCTQVIGFSQTRQWYLDAPDFEQIVGSDRWELKWKSGAAIQLWGDPGYGGWTVAPASPCIERSNDPDRVVLTISGDFEDDPAVWEADIGAAIDVIRQKYQGVEQIALQPVVGGPNHQLCFTADGATVRASSNHPVIDQAISEVVGGDVVAGDSPEVRTCDDYADARGHLVDSAKGPIGATIGAFYAP